ncbi:root phototropism protein 3-like [Salvia hispanica]|uniref:root phototropism protein 3-like n=1 Tax=Salvia hispanica TaxID=49212 RepID=UPI00200910BD|nr:root phototropism protein 3-like [Salvia hispanica]
MLSLVKGIFFQAFIFNIDQDKIVLYIFPLTHKRNKNTNILEMDDFIKTLSEIKGNKISPDLIGSIITRYASIWLPELAADESSDRPAAPSGNPPESVTLSWTKKRFIIESLVGILPPEKDSIPTDFLLRILRAANIVRVEPACLFELEKRVSRQLDQASLKELMIPSFSHTSSTLLDVDLVLRLVGNFVSTEEAARGGPAVGKVARLVDSYLAEAALDSCLALPEFVALAGALPRHARPIDDGLYRAIDTYLKAHPGLSKKERKTIWSLIDCNKLTQEACLHAAQNDRLPVRAVIQVLLWEQSRLANKHLDWSGTLSGQRSPAELPGRCLSKRETGVQQMEIKKLKEEVLRLQSQCMAMERQIEKLSEKKRGSFLSWKKLGISGFKGNRIAEMEQGTEINGIGPYLVKTKVRGRTPNRRKSMS